MCALLVQHWQDSPSRCTLVTLHTRVTMKGTSEERVESGCTQLEGASSALCAVHPDMMASGGWLQWRLMS
jgi:hypothetical protein